MKTAQHASVTVHQLFKVLFCSEFLFTRLLCNLKWLFHVTAGWDLSFLQYELERWFCVYVVFVISGCRFKSGYLCVIFLSSETLTSTRPVLQAQDIYPSLKTEAAFSTFCQIDCQGQGEIVFQVCPCSAVSKFSLENKKKTL